MTLRLSHRGSVSEAIEKHLPELIRDKVASRIFQRDHTLWGKNAEAESAIRLGWVDAAATTLQILPEITELANTISASGITKVVLCGMGGSSLAPEVICKSFGLDLVVLDSTDPSAVRAALNNDLEKCVVVVSSKSGSTVETDSQKRSFEAAFDAAGIQKTERIIIVTDPDSPMHKQALADSYRVFLADPMVGGRYSALTAFGAVPSVFAGAPMKEILESALAATELVFSDDESNPALLLGTAMARTRGGQGFKDKLGLVPDGSSIQGLGDWAEQLIAESTGKLGRGILPVVLEDDAPELESDSSDLLLIGLSEDATESKFDLAVSGDLGEQLLLWEVATAVASRLIGVNPFDQPDVEAAKIAARAMLESPGAAPEFIESEHGLEISASGYELASSDMVSSIDQLLGFAQEKSFVSIQCYLDRTTIPHAIELRKTVSSRINRPTTFGWGPRFLHSTGQYHKGGPKQGVYLQILSGSQDDQPIPGREFGYRALIASQANGDAEVLSASGSKVLRIRLANPADGIDRLIGLLS